MNLTDIASVTGLHRARERIVGIDRCVPLLDGSLQRYVNLDNAASTPCLSDVLDTVNGFMEWYSSVHRGDGLQEPRRDASLRRRARDRGGVRRRESAR